MIRNWNFITYKIYRQSKIKRDPEGTSPGERPVARYVGGWLQLSGAAPIGDGEVYIHTHGSHPDQ